LRQIDGRDEVGEGRPRLDLVRSRIEKVKIDGLIHNRVGHGCRQAYVAGNVGGGGHGIVETACRGGRDRLVGESGGRRSTGHGGRVTGSKA